MGTHSVGDVARHFTATGRTYVSPGQVYTALVRLVSAGLLPDRRAGRSRVVLTSELPLIAAKLGLPVQEVSRAE